MKRILGLVALLVLVLPVGAFAWDRHNGNYTKDDYGHYTRNDNLYNDSDGDGVANINDSSDRNPYKWN